MKRADRGDKMKIKVAILGRDKTYLSRLVPGAAVLPIWLILRRSNPFGDSRLYINFRKQI